MAIFDDEDVRNENGDGEEKSTGFSGLKKKNALSNLDCFAETVMQIAFLIEDGIAVQDAVEIIAKDTSDPSFGPVLKQVSSNISHGLGLSESFAETKFFPSDFLAILKVGESSGHLPTALRRYLEHIRSSMKITKSFNSALNYPLFLVILLYVFSVFAFVYIAPQIIKMITEVTNGQAVALPVYTQFLIFMNKLCMTGGMTGIIVVSVVFAFYIISGAARRHIIAGVGRIKKVKKMMHDMEWSRWLVMGGICLHAGMTAAEMIQYMGDGPLPTELSGAGVYENLKRNVVIAGSSISEEFAKLNVTSSLVTLISVAEHTGRLEDVFTSRGLQMLESINSEIEGVKMAVNITSTLTIMVLISVVIISVFGSMLSLTTMIQ